MKKLLIVTVSCLGLVACEDLEVWDTDQVMRQKLFKECLTLVPEGPKTTHYNDWSEVIKECDRAAYYQSRYCVKNCKVAVNND